MARILIANDDSDLLDCCRSILEDAGHMVEALKNGVLLVMRARTWRPDLVLIDWVMPALDGPSAIAALRAHPATALVPIILMSGTEADETVALRTGANAFLPKPFQSEELLDQVAALLQDEARPLNS
jgi:CheY-like chemotaxis protein